MSAPSTAPFVYAAAGFEEQLPVGVLPAPAGVTLDAARAPAAARVRIGRSQAVSMLGQAQLSGRSLLGGDAAAGGAAPAAPSPPAAPPPPEPPPRPYSPPSASSSLAGLRAELAAAVGERDELRVERDALAGELAARGAELAASRASLARAGAAVDAVEARLAAWRGEAEAWEAAKCGVDEQADGEWVRHELLLFQARVESEIRAQVAPQVQLAVALKAKLNKLEALSLKETLSALVGSLLAFTLGGALAVVRCCGRCGRGAGGGGGGGGGGAGAAVAGATAAGAAAENAEDAGGGGGDALPAGGEGEGVVAGGDGAGAPALGAVHAGGRKLPVPLRKRAAAAGGRGGWVGGPAPAPPPAGVGQQPP
jgi:hypothetical protein